MRAFAHEALPVRVPFGWGMIAEVAAEAERLGMRRALGAADAARGLEQLARALGTVRALRDIRMPEDGIDRVVEAALTQPPWNPRKLTEDGLRAMLARAWRGAPPGAD